MLRKKEQRLWDRMRHAFVGKMYLERIENAVNVGRPDVDVMLDGIVVPIELKAVAAYPKRNTTPVLGNDGLNSNQLNWWLNWQRWGGKGFIVIGVVLDIFAVPCVHSEIVNDFNRDQLHKYMVTWMELIYAIRKETKCLQNR